MFGGGYTSAAVSDSKRTVDLPVDEQVRISTGLEYAIGEHRNVGGNHTFRWLGDNGVDQPANPIAGQVELRRGPPILE